jgi:RNA polymerase sigma factor (sigma-70 family)
MTADTDWRSVVTAAAGGDDVAWRTLVDQYSGLVWSVARSFRLDGADAADVFQTTWLRLAEHIGKITDPDRVGAWLATVARRECLRTIKAGGRSMAAGDMSAVELTAAGRREAEEDPVSGAVLAAEQERSDAARAAVLWEAFGGLSGRCRELLRVLMAVPPPSYAEVAAALDMPVGSIGPTRARCLQRLRDALAGRISGDLTPS